MKTLNLFSLEASGKSVDELAAFEISNAKMNYVRGGNGGGEIVEDDLGSFDIWFDDSN